MEFGVITFIIPDTIFNSMKKYMDYELEPDENSQILFTYDNEPDVIKEFDMKNTTTTTKMKKRWYYSRQRPGFSIESRQRHVFPIRFDFQTEKCGSIFSKDEPVYSQESGLYTLKSLYQIFHKHNNWTNHKSSIYNCVYYIHSPDKKNVFSILKISTNRYLLAYHPKYLNKIEVEQIVFELFTEHNT
jgi:hypothetical protein